MDMDEQVEHLVDTVPMSYFEARMVLGIPEPDYSSVEEYRYPTRNEQRAINAEGIAAVRAAFEEARLANPGVYGTIA